MYVTAYAGDEDAASYSERYEGSDDYSEVTSEVASAPYDCQQRWGEEEYDVDQYNSDDEEPESFREEHKMICERHALSCVAGLTVWLAGRFVF